MRNHAAAAILHAIFQPFEIAAAGAAQRVQWAVAEQAIEVFRMRRFMAREEFTVPVLNKGIIAFLRALVPYILVSCHSTYLHN